jgi:hypothetical protein
MSQVKKDYSKQRNVFDIKKTAAATKQTIPDNVQIFVDGVEIEYEYSENKQTGKKSKFLWINKIDDEIKRIEKALDEGKMKQETANSQLEYLKKKKGWGFSSFVKAFIK